VDDNEVLVEHWKKAVDVQQHFNDIELRIRNIAITLQASVLGIAALAIREDSPLVACLIFVAGLVALLAFFFMDYLWYHRLLLGAVEYGREIEKRMAQGGIVPLEGLTGAIGRMSAYRVPQKWWLPFFRGRELHSNAKMKLFYGTFLMTMMLGAITSGIFAALQGTPQPKEVQRIEAYVVVRDTVHIGVPESLRKRALESPHPTNAAK